MYSKHHHEDVENAVILFFLTDSIMFAPLTHITINDTSGENPALVSIN